MLLNDKYLVYILILVISGQAVLIIWLIIIYLRSLGKSSYVEKGKTSNIDPMSLLREAQIKAQKILEDAHIRSKDILLQSDNFTIELQDKISEEIAKSSKLYASRYEESLKETQEASLKILQNIPEDIKAQFAKEIQSVHITIEEEVKKAEQEARQVVMSAYQKAEKEVENYKLERIRQVDESVIMILKDVARRVLSKEISLDEHEKLVIKALEEAKHQGVFSNTQDEIENPRKDDKNV